MNILAIPFVKLLDIQKSVGGLSLYCNSNNLNHLESMHAGAIYTLAESGSRVYLQEVFKDIEADIAPLLRESSIKYKKEIKSNVIAKAMATSEDIDKFRDRFSKRGRATIAVNVEIIDLEDNICAVATFSWFIQNSNIK